MNKSLTELTIDSVTVRKRLRTNNGDLENLAASVRKLGLLSPIVVDMNNVLVAGGRRIEACRLAGLSRVPALKLDVDCDSMEALNVQSDENLCRKPLSSEELEALILEKKALLGGKTASGGSGFFSRLKNLFRRRK